MPSSYERHTKGEWAAFHKFIEMNGTNEQRAFIDKFQTLSAPEIKFRLDEYTEYKK